MAGPPCKGSVFTPLYFVLPCVATEGIELLEEGRVSEWEADREEGHRCMLTQRILQFRVSFSHTVGLVGRLEKYSYSVKSKDRLNKLHGTDLENGCKS